VSMCDQYGVDCSRVKRGFLPVAFAQLFQTLKHTAVDEDTRAFSFD